MEKLVALHRNDHGGIISFQTSQGRIISYRKAVMEAENGLLEGVEISLDSDGEVILTPISQQSFDDLPPIN